MTNTNSPENPVAPAPAFLEVEPLPYAPKIDASARTISSEDAQRWRDQIALLVKEADARKGDPSSVSVWFEAGRIYEAELGDFRNAAVHYQKAHVTDPGFIPVIHAARRLFASVERWGAVIKMIEQELKVVTQKSERVPLLYEMARLNEVKLQDIDAAKALYVQLLDDDHEPAVKALRRLYERDGDDEKVAALLESSAEKTNNKARKIAFYLAAGRVFESRLDALNKALGCYEAARDIDPNRTDILTVLARLHRTRGDTGELAIVLGALADRGAAQESVYFLQERALLLAQKGDDEAAIETLLRARARAPENTLVLPKLATLLEKREDWSEFENVLDAQARATHDIQERIALHAEAGLVCERKMNAPERAISHYHSCVELDPNFQPALRALGKLYSKTGQFQALSDVYEVQLQVAEAEQKVPLLFKQAELLATQLEQSESAIENLKSCLEVDPSYLPALKLLARLYGALERIPELIAMYELELESADKDQSIFLLEKIASLYEHRLKNLEKTAEAYRQILSLKPGHMHALRNLGRLYSRLADWESLIEINREEAERINDQAHVVSLLQRNGELLAERLNRPEDAIEIFRRVLTLAPNYVPALRSLGRMYSESGRYDDLIEMHRDELEVAKDPSRRAQLLSNIAEIHDTHLNQKDKASGVYHEVLEHVPDHQPSLRALARYARQQDDRQETARLLKSEIERVSAKEDQAVLRCRLADTLLFELDDPAEAENQIRQALVASPSLLEAHERLVSLYASKGRPQDEADAREQMNDALADVGSHSDNLLTLSALYSDTLGDAKNGLATLERFLELQPTHEMARRRAVDLAQDENDYARSILHASELAELTSDLAERASLYLSIADWKEGRLSPPEDPLRALLKALQADPHHPIAVRRTEAEYLARHEWRGLYSLYERELHAQKSAPARADLSVKMGELAERWLDDKALAIRDYEAALDAVPDFLPAIARLRELYAALSRPKDRLRLLALEARSSVDETHAVGTLLEVAQLYRDEYDDSDAATQIYFQVLDRDPKNEAAFNELETLLTFHEKWSGLSQLYTRWAEGAEGQRTKVETFVRAADIADNHLHNPKAAAAIYEKILAVTPQDASALARVADYQYSQGEYAVAVAYYTRLLNATEAPEFTGLANFRLGVAYDEHLNDSGTGAEHLAVAVEQLPGDRDVLAHYAGVLARALRFDDSVNVYTKLLESATSPTERRLFQISLARVHENGPGGPEAAAAVFAKAIDECSDDEERLLLIQRAMGLYERSNDLEGYLAMSEAQAKNLSEKSPKSSAQILHQCAQMFEEQRGDSQTAIRLARQGLESYNDLELRGFLADLLSKSPNQFAAAAAEHRRVLNAGVLRPESIHSLFKGWNHNGARDRAFVAAEILNVLGLANDEEKDFVARESKRVSAVSDKLSTSEIMSWVVHPAHQNIFFEVMAHVGAELGKLPEDDLSPYAVDKNDILKPRSNERLRALADEIARPLGGFNFVVNRTHTHKLTVRAHQSAPVVLMVGADVERTLREKERRFVMASGIFDLFIGAHLMKEFSIQDFKVFANALVKAVDKNFISTLGDPAVDNLSKRISQSLSRGTKKSVLPLMVQLGDELESIDFDAYHDALPLTLARGAHVLSNDFATSFKMLESSFEIDGPISSYQHSSVVSDLNAYVLSDGYFNARQKLGVAVDA